MLQVSIYWTRCSNVSMTCCFIWQHEISFMLQYFMSAEPEKVIIAQGIFIWQGHFLVWFLNSSHHILIKCCVRFFFTLFESSWKMKVERWKVVSCYFRVFITSEVLSFKKKKKVNLNENHWKRKGEEYTHNICSNNLFRTCCACLRKDLSNY